MLREKAVQAFQENLPVIYTKDGEVYLGKIWTISGSQFEFIGKSDGKDLTKWVSERDLSLDPDG